jgi:hypothetical protein
MPDNQNIFHSLENLKQENKKELRLWPKTDETKWELASWLKGIDKKLSDDLTTLSYDEIIKYSNIYLKWKKCNFKEINQIDHTKLKTFFKNKYLIISFDNKGLYISSSFWGKIKDSLFMLNGYTWKINTQKHGYIPFDQIKEYNNDFNTNLFKWNKLFNEINEQQYNKETTGNKETENKKPIDVILEKYVELSINLKESHNHFVSPPTKNYTKAMRLTAIEMIQNKELNYNDAKILWFIHEPIQQILSFKFNESNINTIKWQKESVKSVIKASLTVAQDLQKLKDKQNVKIIAKIENPIDSSNKELNRLINNNISRYYIVINWEEVPYRPIVNIINSLRSHPTKYKKIDFKYLLSIINNDDFDVNKYISTLYNV